MGANQSNDNEAEVVFPDGFVQDVLDKPMPDQDGTHAVDVYVKLKTDNYAWITCTTSSSCLDKRLFSLEQVTKRASKPYTYVWEPTTNVRTDRTVVDSEDGTRVISPGDNIGCIVVDCCSIFMLLAYDPTCVFTGITHFRFDWARSSSCREMLETELLDGSNVLYIAGEYGTPSMRKYNLKYTHSESSGQSQQDQSIESKHDGDVSQQKLRDLAEVQRRKSELLSQLIHLLADGPSSEEDEDETSPSRTPLDSSASLELHLLEIMADNTTFSSSSSGSSSSTTETATATTSESVSSSNDNKSAAVRVTRSRSKSRRRQARTPHMRSRSRSRSKDRS